MQGFTNHGAKLTWQGRVDTQLEARLICWQTKTHALFPQVACRLLKKDASHNVRYMNEPKNAADGFPFDGILYKVGRRNRGKGWVVWLIHI